MTSHIPVWLDGKQKYISGVTKATTCNDIIYSVLKINGGFVKDVTNYAIYERWQEVERPLDGRIKILKIWRVWGLEQENVKLTIKKLRTSTNSSRENILYTQIKQYSKSNSRNKKYSHKKEKKEKLKRYQVNFDKLVKVVYAQDCKIQEQLEQIERTETEIEMYETKIHFHRLRKNGVNYLQDSYLCPVTQSNDEDSDGRLSDIDASFELFNKIVKYNEELELQENKLNELTFIIQQENARLKGDLEECSFIEDIANIKQTLEICEKLYNEHDLELKDLESSLNDNECMLEEKSIYFNALVKELENTEKEICLTIEKDNHNNGYNEIVTSSVSQIKKLDFSDSDTNSDTGLSSLHSSNDEEAYSVETLV